MNRFIRMALVVALTITQTALHSQTDNPVADPKAVIVSGQARFTVLTPQLIRLEWSEKGTFEDRASLVFINRDLPAPEIRVGENDGWLNIATGRLDLFYKVNSGDFGPGNLYITFMLNGKEVRWQPGMKDTLNLKGTTRTLDATNGARDVKLQDGLLSRAGWYLHDDSETNLFDENGWVAQREQQGHQDWYFFGYGHEYKRLLYDFTRLAGRIPMPPRFAFGYWWSRYWMYSDEELRQLIGDMRLHGMPIDVLVVDMDWHKTFSLSVKNTVRDEFGEGVGWTGYTWNRNLFPEPEKFLAWAGEQHLKTALNLHPASGIAPMEEVYDEFAQAYGFDTTGLKNIPFRLEEKKWTKIYFDLIIRRMEKQGVDFWWLDWQQWPEARQVRNLSNTWWLNHVFFTDMEKNSNNRPLLFHRWGGLGNHRYQIGFSGDTYITWQSLDYQSYFTPTASNVGYGYWSHDIGGHMGGIRDPELYLRWIQSGAFSPILRTHSTKSKDIERRMFMFPEYYNMMLGALRTRYALNPYIYTAAREAFDSGVSLCRPMYYRYPEALQAYEYGHQYMFGNDMIVAPVGAPSVDGLSPKKVWLPEGDWYELYTGHLLKGDSVVQRQYALNEFPVFVRSGAIIPMYPETVKNLQVISDTLVLCFIPGNSGSARIYDDEGNSQGYRKDECSFTSVHREVKANGNTVVTIQPVEGNFDGMKTSLFYELRFPSTYPVEKVLVNNMEFSFSSEPKHGCWTYDAGELAVKVLIPRTSRMAKITAILVPQKKTQGKEGHLYGKKGLLGRSPAILQKLKYDLNAADPFANLTGNIARLGSLQSYIRYNPAQTLEILSDFDANHDRLIDEIRNLKEIDSIELAKVLKMLDFSF